MVKVYRVKSKKISKDSLYWDIENEKLHFIDALCLCSSTGGNKKEYSWCNNFAESTIGIANTSDFLTFNRLENTFFPCNRNDVLFPKNLVEIM